MPEPSYVQGACGAPLLGETIGQNLYRSVQRFGDREALVDRQQGLRLTYRQLWDQTTRCAKGLLAHGVKRGDRVGIWSPNRSEWIILQYASARIGAILVNINPAYKTAELEYALRQSEVSLLVLARAFRTSDYAGMLQEVRGRLSAARGDAGPRRGLGRPAAGRRADPGRDPGRPRVGAAVRRPHQHSVHLGHDRLPQGRDALPPQHPQQRLLHRRGAALHRAGPRLHPGALLPLLRHGARQPRLHHPRRLHGGPGRGLRAAGGA